MNKIALITWLNGRERLSKKVLKYYAKFPFAQRIAVGTNFKGCPKSWRYIEHENKPLGAKWNRAFQELKGSDFDYVMIIGSDDYLSQKYLDFCFFNADADYFEFTDLFVVHETENKAYYFDAVQNCGAGMIIKREFIEHMNYTPVPDCIERGLDRNIKNHLNKLGAVGDVVSYAVNGFVLIDVKNSESMNPIENFSKRSFEVNKKLVMSKI